MPNIPSNFARSLRYAFVAVMVLAFLFPGCRDRKSDIQKEAAAVPVITGKVSTRRVEYTLNQVGTLEASQEVTIRSEIEGRVIDILFEEGKDVRKSEVLVRLDAAKIRAEIRNLKARIEQLEIRRDNKNRSLERNRPLVMQDLVSRQHFDDLETEIKEIKAEIVQVKAALCRQRELLSDTVIRAPFDGVAGARELSVGHYLKAGDSVVMVVALDLLEMTFRVPEKFKGNLFVGQDVLLKVAPYPEGTFTGRVFFIDPKVEVNTRTFQVKATVENSQGLLNPGMFARVEVITEIHERALTVPWESVIKTETETYIYVVDGGVARKVPVHLGKVTNEWAEVLDTEVLAGATVIVEGKFSVRDGVRIAVQPAHKGQGVEKP